MEEIIFHKPVLADEVIEFLQLENAHNVLDATLGCGGHASRILEKIKPTGGFLIGMDCDKESLGVADRKLKRFDKSYVLACGNFGEVDKILLQLSRDRIDGALFDLGISSYQLGDAGRGFSFTGDGPVDMRMDRSKGLSAYDIINGSSRDELENIIRDFGEERYFRRITGFIIDGRKKKKIRTTSELSRLIEDAVGRWYKSQRIHPATRTFQALRIAVNAELDNLKKGLTKVLKFVNSGRRICVISFHSLEDRIVKTKFMEFEKNGEGRRVTKKPIIPTRRERDENPRARSAKLRVFEVK